MEGRGGGGRKVAKATIPTPPSLPLEIFKERKQSFSWGAGVQPHRIKTMQGTVPSRKTCSPAAPQLLGLAIPLKAHIWAPASARVAGVRGSIVCGSVREGCHLSFFQEGLSPFSPFVTAIPKDDNGDDSHIASLALALESAQ